MNNNTNNNSQLTNLTSEIVFAKTAASSATAKVTKVLNDVQMLKLSNIDIIRNISDISNQLLNVNNLIHNISEDTNDYIEKSIFYQNINTIDNNISDLHNKLSNLVISGDLSGNLGVSSIIDEINSIKENNSILSNIINKNLTFLSNQDNLLKNDIHFNNSLIDNNSINVYNLQNKLNNLVNILNEKLNLNININTL